MSKFVFPYSIQSDLFSYLRPEQQDYIKPILRPLKKSAQEDLCCSLLDYMETGVPTLPADFMLASLFIYATSSTEDVQDDPSDRRIIRPLKANPETKKLRNLETKKPRTSETQKPRTQET